jgi:cytidylate kinase
MKNSVIAIDGPSASGKSTVARMVAKELGWLYVDSGALYRAVTWKALKDGLDTKDSTAVAALAESLTPQFGIKDGAVSFELDGIALNRELRTENINRNVSPVAAEPTVRKLVTQWLRDMLELGNLVMEGRDIGTAVFADSQFKFYLDASPEERARRRHAEMEEAMSVNDVQESLSRRDEIDSKRMTAPLQIADDADIIDSTAMDADQVSAHITGRVRQTIPAA